MPVPVSSAFERELCAIGVHKLLACPVMVSRVRGARALGACRVVCALEALLGHVVKLNDCVTSGVEVALRHGFTSLKIDSGRGARKGKCEQEL